MDAVPAGGLGGTFGGNPLSCAAAVAVLEAVREPEFLAARGGASGRVRARLDELASRHAEIGEVRGLGPMIGIRARRPDAGPCAGDRRCRVRARPAPLACGLYGNVIRLLAALTISDEELGEGLALLEESVGGRAA